MDGTLLNLPTVPGGDVPLDEDISTSTTIAVGSNGQTLPQAIINLASVTGLATSGVLAITTSVGVQTVYYTGISSLTITGCIGGIGTMSTGGAVTNNLKMPVSKLYTGAKGVNGGAVTPANPLPISIAANAVQIVSGTGTPTTFTTGVYTQIISSLGRKEVHVQINIKNAPTGGGTISVLVQELDPIDQTTVFTGVQAGYTIGPFNAVIITDSYFISTTGVIKVTVTVAGAGTTFTGVNLWAIDREESITYGQTSSGATNALSCVNIDTSNNTVCVGTIADGTAASGSPVMHGGVGGAAGTTTYRIGAGIDRGPMLAGTQRAQPVMGQSSGSGRIIRADRMGHVLPGAPTLLFEDAIEGTTINSTLWTSSASTMSIAQTGGLLTLNANATTTTGTYAIITSIKQFPIGRNEAPLVAEFQINASQTTNAVMELGFGAPVGVTALVGNGVVFCRISATSVGKLIVVYNGTESPSTTATLVASTYYLIKLWREDGQGRLVIESSAGTPLLDTQIALPIGSPMMGAGVSHSPVFARVYTSGAAGAAPKINIAHVAVKQYDLNQNEPWPDQLVGMGLDSGYSPVALASTSNLYAATPTPITPTSTAAGALAFLDGEYAFNVTASAETPLGLFTFPTPTPWSTKISYAQIGVPIVMTAIGATALQVEYILALVKGSDPSAAGAILRSVSLGMFTAAAAAVAGTFLTGTPIILAPAKAPLFIANPGQYVMILVKVLSGAAISGGAIRGTAITRGTLE